SAKRLNTNRLAGLSRLKKPGQANQTLLDPAAVANQAQNLPRPSKLALPAILAANANQQRLLTEMQEAPEMGGEAFDLPANFGHSKVLVDGNGFVLFSVKLL